MESNLCYSVDIAVGPTSEFNVDEDEWSKQHLAEVILGASLGMPFLIPEHDTPQPLQGDVVRPAAGDGFCTSRIDFPSDTETSRPWSR